MQPFFLSAARLKASPTITWGSTMHKVLSIAALGVMFAGSVLADSIGMEAQKQQMEINERVARGEISKDAAGTVPPIAPNQDTSLEVQDGRDMVGTPLDDGKTSDNTIGGDHIIEMGDNVPDDDTDPMTVDGGQ